MYNLGTGHLAKAWQHYPSNDKFPLNILRVPLIYAIFPNAKFIFAARHPFDACLSCFMQDFALNDAMANF